MHANITHLSVCTTYLRHVQILIHIYNIGAAVVSKHLGACCHSHWIQLARVHYGLVALLV